ncbi:unnamed protein product [Ambrosiozyma monospora]|uniref:Unnamed protein product n=1 Tax=Ambrosiozyma monospora TaxID=43982 RepID=A0A9W7DN53_AMBMO|nr:unnamed protein product [Ambrosiozyma monospora]
MSFDDERITQLSFELALARLYGTVNIKEENNNAYSMIAIGQYLDISEVVCTATDYIVRQMDMSNISQNIVFAISSNYGSASARIIENGKGILTSDGWQAGVASWDDIPVSVISQVIGEDYFFVPTEWDRCMFIIKLIERRLEAGNDDAEDILLLKNVLNHKIHYCHMPPEKLQDLETYFDINGNPYIDPQVLHQSLWQAVYLQRMVVTSRDNSNLSKLISSPEPPTTDCPWFRVPIKDETLSGLPTELDRYLNESLSSTVSALPDNDDIEESGKATQGNFESEKVYTWTKIPPFRFSIAFANVSDLQSDKRVYGKTFWYAGSYWNLYLQKNHIPAKNTYQVGVYLHRANNATSNISAKNGLLNPDIFLHNVNYETSPKRYSQFNNLPSESDFDVYKFNSGLKGQEEKENIRDDTMI